MKNLFTSILLLFILIGNAQIDLSLNLLACYPIKGNTIDASGNNHNGTASGGSFTNDKNNYTNCAYKFSSSTDRVTVPFSFSLDISST